MVKVVTMNEAPPPPPEGPVPPAQPVPPTQPAQPFQPAAYPVDLSIEYQDRELNRTTTFFRLFAAIPILIIISAIGAYGTAFQDGTVGWSVAAAGVLGFPTALMIIFREKYPRWWFDFSKELTAFSFRVGIYLLLLDDRYPSTTDRQSLQLKLEYPDVQRELSRFMPIIKWLLAFPHYVVLFFLWIVVFFATIFAWFAILFTGRYPRWIFDFVVGVQRWTLRVEAYVALLVTDKYPPFRLES